MSALCGLFLTFEERYGEDWEEKNFVTRFESKEIFGLTWLLFSRIGLATKMKKYLFLIKRENGERKWNLLLSLIGIE